VTTAELVFFPLDRQLQVAGERWSDGLRKLAVWLDGLLTFERAESVLAKVGHLAMSDTTAWRQAQACGARAQALENAQRAAATAMPDRQQVVPGEAPSTQRLAVAMDGGMLPIRGEGWKELKVGGLGRIVLTPTHDPVTGDRLELARMVENSYVAHLGGPALFGQQVWAEAKARGWSQAADTVVLGDGAPWIWNLAGEHFYDSVQIVDWYHAKEHLSQAANLLHGEGTPAAQAWLKHHETILFEGHAERIADSVTHAAKGKRKVAKDLRGHAGYFRDNQRRMQYLERREDDYPIGSGTAESGCKQFRARFVGSGMRWCRAGAENLLPVRAAVMSRRFDAFWSALYPSPLN
jgi:hypothetical protein